MEKFNHFLAKFSQLLTIFNQFLKKSQSNFGKIQSIFGKIQSNPSFNNNWPRLKQSTTLWYGRSSQKFNSIPAVTKVWDSIFNYLASIGLWCNFSSWIAKLLPKSQLPKVLKNVHDPMSFFSMICLLRPLQSNRNWKSTKIKDFNFFRFLVGGAFVK